MLQWLCAQKSPADAAEEVRTWDWSTSHQQKLEVQRRSSHEMERDFNNIVGMKALATTSSDQLCFSFSFQTEKGRKLLYARDQM